MNNAVGIDVSKGSSVVTIMRPFGEVVASPFKIKHTQTELKKLLHQINGLEGESRVVVEATGKYHLPVTSFLSQNGIWVSSVNPKLIKDFNNNSLRNVKSDKADSIKIAQYCLINWDLLKRDIDTDTIRIELKALNRQLDLGEIVNYK